MRALKTRGEVSSMPSEFGQSGERWFDLFSRGSRDWLRHNAKVREAVRESLLRFEERDNA